MVREQFTRGHRLNPQRWKASVARSPEMAQQIVFAEAGFREMFGKPL